MKINVATTPDEIVEQSDLYSAITTAISKVVADCSDGTKDKMFKRHIKIDLIITPDYTTGRGAIAVGKVDTVLAPTVCKMPDDVQMSIDDYTGEVGK